MTEAEIMKRIQLRCSRGASRLFRMNVGLSWAGKVINQTDDTITLKNPRPIKSGVTGMCDLGGWKTVIITPEMVGQRVAISTWVEVKTEKGRLRDGQPEFIAAVLKAGGIAGVARSEEEATLLLNGTAQGVGLEAQ